jgi:hypothetical protein
LCGICEPWKAGRKSTPIRFPFSFDRIPADVKL